MLNGIDYTRGEVGREQESPMTLFDWTILGVDRPLHRLSVCSARPLSAAASPRVIA